MFKLYALLVITAAGFLAPQLVYAQVAIGERMEPGQPPLVIAHRYARLDGAPENSLAWLGAALDRGIDMVKLDAQLTGDGHYVLMHDPTLNRTTDVERVFPDGVPGGPTRERRGGKDYIGDYTLGDLRRLRLTDGTDGADHTIPTLEEALEMAEGRILVLLDLKRYEARSVVPLLQGHDTGNLLLFGIFYYDASLLSDVASVTGIGTFVSMERTTDCVADLDKLSGGQGALLAVVVVPDRRMTPDCRARAAELDIRVAVSGVHDGKDAALDHGDASDWLAAISLGAPAYMTGQPDLLMKLLDR
ncbi:glycerophosphodiester phosphodiesterase family protein [Tropicimonas sp. IMCC6043]|uniref:glycerophosphodiester phosphodiesterase family protein n=1 Tax=Tropicimonas sp. IMCC6043 TaxID=2510645 RepID=UPI00101C7121|nr:glycerophosphodiester phosphodiesterase family protein [Tropicimonas sp. IMCC6043]RYH08808.1 glycerophosphodiester phosphodiesterase family protein [Tropicimonas sp. IMCC6043]